MNRKQIIAPFPEVVMKPFALFLVTAFLLAACGNAPTQPAPTPTDTAAPFVPVLPALMEPRVNGTADTPPEFTSGSGGEITGISRAEMDYLMAWEVYEKIYRDEAGAETFAAQEDFVAEMLSYLEKKSAVGLIVRQDTETGRVLAAVIKKAGNQESVYWDFDNGVLANTNPMSLRAESESGLVACPAGTTCDFRYNATDGHWYMYAVDKDGKAVSWFATAGATIDNQNEHWVSLEKVYTSGADPELQAEVIAEATETFGMTPAEKLEAMDRNWPSFKDETRGIYRSDQMVVGGKIIFGSEAVGFDAKDRIVIVYTAEKGNAGVLIPYIWAYEDHGKFYQVTYPGTYSGEAGSVFFADSIDSLFDYFEKNSPPGTIVNVDMQTFGSNDKTPVEWLGLKNDFEKSNLGQSTEAVLKLIEMLNNNFMNRMTKDDAKGLVVELDASKGDLGLFARVFKNR